MEIIEAPLSGLLLMEPAVFRDQRGYFYELFQQERYREMGLPPFVQTNVSHSNQNVLRGLHYQKPHAQGKLVCVIKGSVWDVVVDIRQQSKTFGQWFSVTLSDDNHKQMYIPPGFAHGFCVLSKEAVFYYQCTEFYNSECEYGIAWNDSELNIPWPIKDPILSNKDKSYPYLRKVSHANLFP
jgi:dTDP-4-dehydrorhamnose 3,5-epimerase